MTRLRLCWTVLLGFCAFLLPAVSSNSGEGVPFSTIDQGIHSGVDTNKVVAIRDAALWSTVWKEHKRTLLSPEEPPAVDFAKEMVIAVFMGRRPSGGFSVNIKDISASEPAAGLTVHFEEVKPGRGCFATAMITSPYHIVRLARREGTVASDHSVQVKNCSR